MEKKFKVQPLKGVEIHNAKSVGTRTVNLLMGEHEGEYVRGDIMDANAVAQAIDEVRGGIDGSHDSLAKLNEEVKTNATVINGAITYANKIAENLQKESETRTSEDDKLNTAISNEATARTNAVKAVDDKLTAEVTARTNADKDINKKIDVINGDSKTDGSIKKAIADVIDAAPEAYDTLKEIADKLKENDDLHAVIQEAITDKASNEALTNEVNRATAKETEIEQSVSDLDALNVKTNKKNIMDAGSSIKIVDDDSNSSYNANIDKYGIDFEHITNSFGMKSNSANYRSSFMQVSQINKDTKEKEAYSIIRPNQVAFNQKGNGYTDATFFIAPQIGQTGFGDRVSFLDGCIFSKKDNNTIKEYLTINHNGITKLDGSDTQAFNTKGGVIDTTKFVSLDDNNKIADSYIPTTVALKTDLSEYIKTSEANRKYLKSTNFTQQPGGPLIYNGEIRANYLYSYSFSTFGFIHKNSDGRYLMAMKNEDMSDTKVYNTNGGLADLNNYAKLTDGNVNSLIKPADISSTNGETGISSTQYVTASTVTISELAEAYNKLITYVRHLDSSLKAANLLTESVVSE